MNSRWPVIGHDWAVALLAARLEHGRAGPPVLFTGPDGVGRTTLARAYAQALNCTGPKPPCGACRACTLIAQDKHPDVQIVEPQIGGRVAITEELKVDQVRQVLHQMPLAPIEARRRVVILRRFEHANASAANALLKTLEEPPAHATLLLTARSADDLWPTVVSRCQVLALRPLPVEAVERALAETWGVEPERAARLAHFSGGRLGWAVRAARDPELLSRREAALDLLGQALAGTRAERFAAADALSRDPGKVRVTLDAWASWWRDVAIVAAGSQAPLTHPHRATELQAQAGRHGLAGASATLAAIGRAQDRLERNAPPRLVLEVLMMDLPRG